ncbi:HAMP domain-containing sensor histidine kinase [Paenibacillus psychroresistens]|uniref:histidine kinase n=1 Tax=Paenibacillus psychroresistens TaxID=1778678 RepID=A0A6B8RPK4_9BACL|nr:HAMP domain-containing sensor histidine kinase [Paenibacillus psychroresistens]QGQ97622.1 HAMP domain-containing sensor histidine kinase [Paenibacillus psychroresistens]
MKSRIVLKLFLLTTVLCSLILASIYVGQTVFFKDYYVKQKVAEIKDSLETYQAQYEAGNGDVQTVQRLEQDFYRDHSSLLTVLDQYGSLKQANDFYLEVNVLDDNTNTTMPYKVPLYNAVGAEEAADAENYLTVKTSVRIYGIRKGTALFPAIIIAGAPDEDGKTFNNELLKKNYDEMEGEAIRKLKQDKNITDKRPLYLPYEYFYGEITKVRLQALNDASSLVQTNPLLLDRINVFQMDLLLNEKKNNSGFLQVQDYEQSNVKYKLFIQPMRDPNGANSYLFAMASLQPVDEAVQMVQNYYVYIVVFVMVLVLLASFYYSITIARPLLRVNQMTKKLAGLDFSAAIPFKSKDEIGDLSRNVISLSDSLHSHIKKLQDDIEKEKQLENIRKEFISDVSHELKTPLSVMKSCISILKDGVAVHKKDHYFAAMDKEVDKMNLLIVDMLDLAKYESGTYRMKMDEFYIDSLIESICEQFTEEISEKKLVLQIQLAPVQVVANQLRIEQVITNFITNAIRYTTSGQNIIVTALEEVDQVIVCVENKGARIPQEQLDKVWDRFYRGDSSRQRSAGGTGLGLAIAKNILELHGVEYGAANTHNGVIFYFYLKKKA